jgi:hydrogenase/urease accessory protein HupE
LIGLSLSLFAHTVRPAYLELFSIGKNHYAVKWKVPIAQKVLFTIKPKFPKDCLRDKDSFYSVKSVDLQLSYWTLSCQERLSGREIEIEGIEKNQIEVLFNFREGDLDYFYKINSKNSIAPISNSVSKSEIIKEYILLGVTHILLGYDHLLFVLGLLFIVVGWKMLLKTITSFTVAHSITLGLSILGYAAVETKFIEALIALSIIILAVEIIYIYYGKKGLLSKYPWAIAFFFGLIHGFGFSFALMELGLPQTQLTLALLFFNVGIEVGQLIFIGAIISLYLLLKNFFSDEKLLKGKVFVVYFIGSIASYWLIERIV